MEVLINFEYKLLLRSITYCAFCMKIQLFENQ